MPTFGSIIKSHFDIAPYCTKISSRCALVTLRVKFFTCNVLFSGVLLLDRFTGDFDFFSADRDLDFFPADFDLDLDLAAFEFEGDDDLSFEAPPFF